MGEPLILGDSLAVMASLARREGLAGKVHMIYMDPPYGIKYASNFQSDIGKRDVKDSDQDLTREPETVKAYRDTWKLGLHTYLSYLRERFLLAREVLADSGSIFVQISDENVHRVREVLDDVFGPENLVSEIVFMKTGGATAELLATVNDYILWFAKDRTKVRFRQLFEGKLAKENDYVFVLALGGSSRRIVQGDIDAIESGRPDISLFGLHSLKSSGFRQFTTVEFPFQGKKNHPGANANWKTTLDGLARLAGSERVCESGDSVRYRRLLDDFPVLTVANVWQGGGANDLQYVVQTATKPVERCLLMTTDPGDLVLDPTCGNGTTTYVAESWGRRWITIDTSRVALAIARQRLLTARFDHYRLRSLSANDVTRNTNGTWLKDPGGAIDGPCTFDCKTVPHVTLKSIAQNQAPDPIFAKWGPQLAAAVGAANALLAAPDWGDRSGLRASLLAKARGSLSEARRRSVGGDFVKLKKSLSDAEWRRWILPPMLKSTRNYITVPNDFTGWYEWEMPFDTDPDWPQPLQNAVTEFRRLWRAKMDDVNACIAARADQEELVDKPFVVPNVLRVSGPFTVEGIIPAEESIESEEESPIEVMEDELESFDADPLSPDLRGEGWGEGSSQIQNPDAYLDLMISLLRKDGVRLLNNRVQTFTRLERKQYSSDLHAEGEWVTSDGKTLAVDVFIGPQYGAVNSAMVEDAIRAARRADVIVFAAFNYDSAAQAVIQDNSDPRLQLVQADIDKTANPAMGGPLKNTVHQQLFTVSGSPRTRLEKNDAGEYIVVMEGVDIYDPKENTVHSTGSGKVAAWFHDSDYDGRTFCITQAFFPDKTASEKIANHLGKGGVIDAERFEAFSGTTSLAFPAGKHKRVAVKVIDPRGSEVMKVHRLDGYGA